MSFMTAFSHARDVFFSSPEGGRCLDGKASGDYLRNRLEIAFAAGWNARERRAQQEGGEQTQEETENET